MCFEEWKIGVELRQRHFQAPSCCESKECGGCSKQLSILIAPLIEPLALLDQTEAFDILWPATPDNFSSIGETILHSESFRGVLVLSKLTEKATLYQRIAHPLSLANIERKQIACIAGFLTVTIPSGAAWMKLTTISNCSHNYYSPGE